MWKFTKDVARIQQKRCLPKNKGINSTLFVYPTLLTIHDWWLHNAISQSSPKAVLYRMQNNRQQHWAEELHVRSSCNLPMQNHDGFQPVDSMIEFARRAHRTRLTAAGGRHVSLAFSYRVDVDWAMTTYCGCVPPGIINGMFWLNVIKSRRWAKIVPRSDRDWL